MMTKRLAALICCVAIAACGERKASSPLAEVAKEPLQAGVGLGDLKLTQTTLGAFAQQFGVGESVVTGEPAGTRVDFVKDGLSFLFRGEPSCAQGLAEQISPTNAQNDVNGYLLQHPECETMLLESIAAYIPQDGEPLYEGETLEGVGLNAAREMAERAYQQTQSALSALESGTELPEQQLQPGNELHYPGIRIYLGKDASGRDVVRKLEVVPRQ